jgi:predicted O-methyltransferase YrrM
MTHCYTMRGTEQPEQMVELPPNDVLRALCRDRVVHDDAGKCYPLEDAISATHAAKLYQMVLKHRPNLVVEVGMAHGVSTLAILTALDRSAGPGSLISIDSHQGRVYHGIGVLNVRRAGLEHRHQLLEMPSHLALPQLLAADSRIEFSYIDGWHTFDYALVDFFYLDKMTSPGGIVAFNDCGWRSVHRVIKFVRTHRSYDELDVGLCKNYRGRNLAASMVRRVTRRSSSDRYFLKTSMEEPDWNFYARF